MVDKVVPKDLAAEWLSRFADAMTRGDANAVANTLVPWGCFRDICVFTWDFRALEGTDKIVSYLSEGLKAGDVTGIKLVEEPFCSPSLFEAFGWIEAAFTFETKVALGRGMVRFMQDPASGQWGAIHATMTAVDLKGYEEATHESGLYGGHTLAWEDVLRERIEKVEKNPYVLISE